MYLTQKTDVETCLCVEVLSVSERKDIEAELTSTRQNQKLLSVLSRKSVEQFQQFLAALDKTDQHHITDRLQLGSDLRCGHSKHFHRLSISGIIVADKLAQACINRTSNQILTSRLGQRFTDEHFLRFINVIVQLIICWFKLL